MKTTNTDAEKGSSREASFTTYSTTPDLVKLKWNISSVNTTVGKDVIS